MAPNSTSETIRPTRRISESTVSSVKEVLYDGYFYDVTNFVKKHPGGSIIEYYTQHGEDATHSIQQFHQRSTKKVSAIMNSFKKRKAHDDESKPKSISPFMPRVTHSVSKNPHIHKNLFLISFQLKWTLRS